MSTIANRASKVRSSRWRRLAVFVACLGLLAVAHRPLFSGMARWLDVGEPPTRVDYVVALPGDMNTRPLVAAAMVRTGMARQVIVPHTQPGAEVEQKLEPAHGNLLETILKGRGVPADAILLIDSRSNSTFDDAQAVASFLRDRPRASLAIVTNDYHTRRARDIFRTALAGLPVELHVVSAPTDGFAADDWWETRTGFQAYANEFGKVLSYWLYYGHGLYWLGAAAVVFAAWRLIAARRVRASAQ